MEIRKYSINQFQSDQQPAYPGKIKNILVLALSTLPARPTTIDGENIRAVSQCEFSCHITGKEIDSQTYSYQLEPVPKMLIEFFARQGNGEQLDEILMICSAETRKRKYDKVSVTDSVKENGVRKDRVVEENCALAVETPFSAEDYFVQKIIDFIAEKNKSLEGKRKLAVPHFVSIEYENDTSAGQSEAIGKIIAEIRCHKGAAVYVDTHGGPRFFQDIVNDIFSLLREDVNIPPSHVFSVAGRPPKFEVVSAGFSIELLDFVSGMTELMNYGRTDSLNRFFRLRQCGTQDPLGEEKQPGAKERLVEERQPGTEVRLVGETQPGAEGRSVGETQPGAKERLMEETQPGKEERTGEEQQSREEDPLGKEDRELIRTIEHVATGIQLCSIPEFENNLTKLGELLKKRKENPDPSGYNSLLNLFIENIENNYKGLLSDDRTVMDEIRWCLEKGFYQQVLTLIEGKIPEYLHENGMFCFDLEIGRITDRVSGNFETINWLFNNHISKLGPNGEDRLKVFQEQASENLQERPEESLQKQAGKNLQIQAADDPEEQVPNTVADLKKRVPDTEVKSSMGKKQEYDCTVSVSDQNEARLFLLYHLGFKEIRNLANHASQRESILAKKEDFEKFVNAYLECIENMKLTGQTFEIRLNPAKLVVCMEKPRKEKLQRSGKAAEWEKYKTRNEPVKEVGPASVSLEASPSEIKEQAEKMAEKILDFRPQKVVLDLVEKSSAAVELRKQTIQRLREKQILVYHPDYRNGTYQGLKLWKD